MRKIFKNNLQISISKKFTYYSLIICSIVLLYITYSFFDQQYNRNKQVVNDAILETNFAHRELEDAIQYSSILVKNLTREIRKNPDDHQYIADVLKKFKIVYSSEDLSKILSISMFSWVDKSKSLLINSEFGILDEPIDLSKRDYIPLTIKNPNVIYFGKPVSGAVSKQHIIPFGIGITDKNGIYQGTIVAGINIYGIYKRIITTNILQGSIIRIIFNKSQDVISQEKLQEAKFLSKINFEDNDVQLVKDFSLLKEDNAILYKNLANSKYGILLTINNKYTDRYYIKKNYLVQALSILLIFLLLVFFFRRKFIDPVLNISNLATRISNGDTGVKVPKTNIKELNKLAKSINEIRNFVIVENALKVKLGKAIKDKEKIVSATSHDLRNYIAGIGGLIDLILSEESSGKGGKKEKINLLNSASQQTKELMYFVEDLLDTSKSGGSELKLGQIEKMDLEEVFNRIILLNKNLLLRNKIETLLNIEDNLPDFYGDIRRVKQILNNLLTNAIKYSPQYSVVKLSVSFMSDIKMFCLRVEDQGIGMSGKEIKMALDGQGQDIDKSELHDKKIDSHGVGMTIVKDLVQTHKGKINIESRKGIGTIFTILLPSLKDTTSSDSSIIKQDHSLYHKLNNKKIILADDEDVNRVFLSKKLSSKYKMQIITVDDGFELYNIYKKNIEQNEGVDIIISDINMPKMDGIEAAKQIRKYENDHKLKPIPIIANCGDSDKNMINKIKKAGINSTFFKGDDITDLMQKICDYLD